MAKKASLKAVEFVKQGRESRALKAMLKVMAAHSAVTPKMGIPRCRVMTETDHRTKNRYKGSTNWSLFHLCNERHIFAKQKKHGGNYYFTKKGVEIAKKEYGVIVKKVA
jgi:hypothetical protein